MFFWLSIRVHYSDEALAEGEEQVSVLNYILIFLMSIPYGLFYLLKSIMAMGTLMRYLNRVHPLYLYFGGSTFLAFSQLVFLLFSYIMTNLSEERFGDASWILVGSLNILVMYFGGTVSLMFFKQIILNRKFDLDKDFKE